MKCENCGIDVRHTSLFECMQITAHVSGYSLLLVFCRYCANGACVLPTADQIIARVKARVA